MAMLSDTLPSVTDQRVLDIKDIILDLFPHTEVSISQKEIEDDKFIEFRIKGNNADEDPKVIAEKMVDVHRKTARKVKNLDFSFSLKEAE